MKKVNSFVRGENQKEVTDSYRDNWERIFGKKVETKTEDKTGE